MTGVKISVRGVPPASKQSVRFINGKAVGVTRISAALKKWTEAVAAAAAAAIAEQQEEFAELQNANALRVQARFLLPGKTTGHHTAPPDLDNLAKALLDALEEIGVIQNDARVAELFLRKESTKSCAGVDIEIVDLES